MMEWSVTNTKESGMKRNSSETKRIGLNRDSRKKVVSFQELYKRCFKREKGRHCDIVKEKQDNTCLKKKEKVIYNYETV